jgi:hypothetical protein
MGVIPLALRYEGSVATEGSDPVGRNLPFPLLSALNCHSERSEESAFPGYSFPHFNGLITRTSPWLRPSTDLPNPPNRAVWPRNSPPLALNAAKRSTVHRPKNAVQPRISTIPCNSLYLFANAMLPFPMFSSQSNQSASPLPDFPSF